MVRTTTLPHRRGCAGCFLSPRYPVGIRDGVPAPGATLIARFQGSAISQFRGYELKVRSNGAWQIVANGPAAVTVANGPAAVTLASGNVTAARAYALSLTACGTPISAQINGVLVATVTDRTYPYGPAGLGSLGYYPVRYLSFTVRPRPPVPESHRRQPAGHRPPG